MGGFIVSCSFSPPLVYRNTRINHSCYAHKCFVLKFVMRSKAVHWWSRIPRVNQHRQNIGNTSARLINIPTISNQFSISKRCFCPSPPIRSIRHRPKIVFSHSTIALYLEKYIRVQNVFVYLQLTFTYTLFPDQ